MAGIQFLGIKSESTVNSVSVSHRVTDPCEVTAAIAQKLGIPFHEPLGNASLREKYCVVQLVALAIGSGLIIIKKNKEMTDPVSGLIRHVSGADVDMKIMERVAKVHRNGSIASSGQDIKARLGDVPCMSELALEHYKEFKAEIEAAVAEPTPSIRPTYVGVDPPPFDTIPPAPRSIPIRPVLPTPTPSTRLLDNNPRPRYESLGVTSPWLVIVASLQIAASSIVAIGAFMVALSTELITTGMCSVDDSPTICKLFMALGAFGVLGILSVIGLNVYVFGPRKTMAPQHACYGACVGLLASLAAAGLAIAISLKASDAKNDKVEVFAITAAVLCCVSGCCCVPIGLCASLDD